MSLPQGRPGPGQNRILQILGPEPSERLRAAGVITKLEFAQVLTPAGTAKEHVYFPLSGIVSFIVRMADGRGVEGAMIGFEGMVGASVVLGENQSPYEVTVQMDGEALRIPAADFRRLVDDDPHLREWVLRYVEVQMVQAMRTAACNRLHEVEERLARWLLQTHDWVLEDRFRVTQEFLATMLGVRRATVTMAAGTLQQAGLITYQRGYITILDRAKLEEMVCEDYVVLRDAFERLLPLPPTA